MYYVGLTIIEEVLNKDGELAALKQAAGLKCLGKYRDAIQRAYSAKQNPSTYLELARNGSPNMEPATLWLEGVKALRNLLEENKAQAPSK